MPLKCEKCGGTHLSNWPCIRRKPDWFDERKEANAIAAKSKFDDIYNAAIAAFKRQRAALASSPDSRSTPTEEKQNPSVAPLVEATFNDTAKNLAQMVTNYVESGIKGGTDWRNGLAIIIALRLKRIQMSKPSLAQAGQEHKD